MAVVYRIFNDSNELLYIGSSKSYLGRIGDHLATKDWAAEICNVSVEHFPTIEQARHAESEAIKWEQPKYNIQGQTSLLYTRPQALLAQMSPREQKLFGAYLFSFGSLPLPDHGDHDCHWPDSLRTIGQWMHDGFDPTQAFRDFAFRLYDHRLLGLGRGYINCENGDEPLDDVRSGIGYVRQRDKSMLCDQRDWLEEILDSESKATSWP